MFPVYKERSTSEISSGHEGNLCTGRLNAIHVHKLAANYHIAERAKGSVREQSEFTMREDDFSRACLKISRSFAS